MQIEFEIGACFQDSLKAPSRWRDESSQYCPTVASLDQKKIWIRGGAARDLPPALPGTQLLQIHNVCLRGL
jgi:hypothetical protein